MSFSADMRTSPIPSSAEPKESPIPRNGTKQTVYYHKNGQGKPSLEIQEPSQESTFPRVNRPKSQPSFDLRGMDELGVSHPVGNQQERRRRLYSKSKEFVNDKEAIAHRHSQINKLEREIKRLTSSESSEGAAGGNIEIDLPGMKRNKEIRSAYESKLNDLRIQLTVYNSLKARTLNQRHDYQPAELSAQLQRDLYRFQGQLPVFSKRMEIEAHLENTDSRFLIIQGQTGSGKSTQLPQYFADHPKFRGQRILCTQPRKIAAIALAERVAYEYSRGTGRNLLGNEIGFYVAGQHVSSTRVRIQFITEGKMLENIISGKAEPFENVGAIILDEAHERSLTCDLLLGCFKSEDKRWKDIKIVVTSATIDLDQFSEFFNSAPTILVAGRTFPVNINYIPSQDFGIGGSTQNIVAASVASTLDIHLNQGLVPGDILCFLPGQADVLGAKEMFQNKYQQAKDKFLKGEENLGKKGRGSNPKSSDRGPGGHATFLEPHVLPLYGRLEQEQQAKIFEPLGSRVRKIIFATDIAETSVTIEGVVHVVDSGVKKGIVYDPKRKISSLQIQQISKSSAIQRMGRAGRTQPGECYRLYSSEDFEMMEFGTTPEVLRRPLALAVLILRKLRMHATTFPWISQPPVDALRSAEEELLLIGALVKDREEELVLTELGHVISTVQQEPSLVKMIYSGCQLGFGEAAVTLASIFSVSNTFFWNGLDAESKAAANKKKKDIALPQGDIVSLYRVFEEWWRMSERTRSTKVLGTWCRDNYVNGKAMKIIVSTMAELKPYFRGTKSWNEMSQDGKPSNDELSRIAFSGLFLNTSHIVKTKNSYGKLQYFSLHTGVLGNCARGSALTHHPNPPDWIIYDRVLQVPDTLFLTSNQISSEWIQEENPEFYQSCLKKCTKLPTSFTKFLPPEIIGSLLGKFNSNTQVLQNELDSTLESDMDSGRLTLYCAQEKVSQVGILLERKIKAATLHLEDKVIEVDYLGGCRLLIGKGYQVNNVLFSEDFVTLYIRNIPVGTNEEDLQKFVAGHLGVSKEKRLHQIQLFRGNSSGTGLVTFNSKETAQDFFQKSTNQDLCLHGQRISTNPSLSKRKGMSAEITGKLKFSWPTGPSKQQARIWFSAGSDANRFIENSGTYLQGAVIKGVGSKADPSCKKLHTPTMRIQAPKGYPMPARFRFDLDRINEMSDTEKASCEFAITVTSIPISMDEYEIKDALRHFKVERVRLDRDKPPDNARVDGNQDEILLPVAKWLKSAPNYPFEEIEARRKGVWITFTRLGPLRDAYREIVSSAPWCNMRKHFGQPCRLEMEYFYTATILKELYQVFEFEIQGIIDYAKSVKIRALNNQGNQNRNNKSKFVTVKFQSQAQTHFPEIQKRMEEVTACTKFQSDDIHVLFTKTGKAALSKFQFQRYLFISFHSKGLWIYGSAEIRGRIGDCLKAIVEHLKSLDFLDLLIPINKKVVSTNREREAIMRECKKLRSLEFFDLAGSTLTVSGQTADVDNLKSILEQRNFLFKPYKRNFRDANLEQECGLCFTPPENGKYVITTACNSEKKCGRVFCLDCIQPMFEQIPPVFPLKCPTCETELVINDILKWASPGSLQKVIEVAVADYKQKNANKILSCPKPACEQLLDEGSTIKGAYGGDFVYCDECVTTYCLTCSKKMDKAMPLHEEESCDEIQSGSSNRARVHVKTIRESILNLQCPRCKTAFFDFKGCAALTCVVSTCGTGFCALCLEDCGNSQATHAHVMHCKFNPKQDFFVSQPALDTAHKSIRTTKIRKYLKDVSYEEQEFILKTMCKDFLDLGIKQTDVQVHLAPSTSVASTHNPKRDQQENQRLPQIRIVPQPQPAHAQHQRQVYQAPAQPNREQPQPQVRVQLQPQVRAQPQPLWIQPHPQVRVQAQPQVLQPQPQVRVQPQPQVRQPQPQVRVQPQPQVRQPQPQVRVQPEPQVRVQPQPQVRVQPQPQVRVQPQPFWLQPQPQIREEPQYRITPVPEHRPQRQYRIEPIHEYRHQPVPNRNAARREKKCNIL